MELAISDIFVDARRQRQDLGDTSSLASSIAEVGLINPLLVEKTGDGGYILVAGERRLTAMKALGWKVAPVTVREDLPPAERELIELHENIRRKSLIWQEEVRAVEKYNKLSPSSQDEIARELGISGSTFSKMLKASEALDNLPVAHQCPTWSGAYDLYMSHLKKSLDSDMESMFETPAEEGAFSLDLDALEEAPSPLPSGAAKAVSKSVPRAIPLPKDNPFEAREVNFTEWAPTYEGRRFNLIHLDPPYGVGMESNPLYHSNPTLGGKHYSDTEADYLGVLNALLGNQGKIVAESAHVICWLTPKMYEKTIGKFTHYGWACSEFPLIWHKSDNSGNLPDPRRWPRRTYEMALFASRGDRKIVKAKAASWAGPINKLIHMSEKPQAMLEHFLSMLVDEHTEVLDPTCGSGNALVVAKALGAKRGLGFDIDPLFVAHTNKGLS